MSRTAAEVQAELHLVTKAISDSYSASSLSMEGRSLTRQRLDVLIQREASLYALLDELTDGTGYKVIQIC